MPMFELGMYPAQTFFQTVGVTSSGVVSASQTRITLAFFGSTLGRITLANISPAVLDQGPTIIQAQAPLIMSYAQFGEVVRKPWFAIAAVAGSQLGVIEVFGG